jgi:membrane associated rhomboid family serine protease
LTQRLPFESTDWSFNRNGIIMETDHHHGIGEEIRGVVLFVAAIWVVFLVSRFVSLDQFALVPRSWHGLVGVVTMPFLHANFRHLLSNTLPLVMLLTLLAGSRGKSPAIVATIILLGGALLWLFGRNGTADQATAHVGASGLVFGLIAFLIVSGITERRLVPLLISVLVGLLFGGTLFWGVLPLQNAHVSWDGHLCGALAGAAAAVLWTSRQRSVTSEA